MNRIRGWLLPRGARNPLLDYEWLHPRLGGSRRRFVLQLFLLGILLGGAALLLDGAAGSGSGVSLSVTGGLWRVLYWPVMALQTLTAVMALIMGGAAFEAQRQGNVWDNLRLTESGAGLALGAGWLGIMYRLRAPITAILLVRLILVLGILFDMTAFGGGYLKMLNAEAASPAADWRVIPPVVALGVTAGLLLPLCMIGSFAALGILTGLAIRERLFAAVAQILLALTVLVFVSGGALAVSLALRAELRLPGAANFLLFLGYSGYGDWGLGLMQLGNLGAIWQRAAGGILIGPCLAAMALAQAFIADGGMRLARHLADRQN